MFIFDNSEKKSFEKAIMADVKAKEKERKTQAAIKKTDACGADLDAIIDKNLEAAKAHERNGRHEAALTSLKQANIVAAQTNTIKNLGTELEISAVTVNAEVAMSKAYDTIADALTDLERTKSNIDVNRARVKAVAEHIKDRNAFRESDSETCVTSSERSQLEKQLANMMTEEKQMREKPARESAREKPARESAHARESASKNPPDDLESWSKAKLGWIDNLMH